MNEGRGNRERHKYRANFSHDAIKITIHHQLQSACKQLMIDSQSVDQKHAVL
jgi:hypothetical protein